MPGQEQILLTKEVIVIRGLKPELFDQFYLLWALTLDTVHDQWRRIVLMQTNREDVGNRLYEIVIPVPKLKAAGKKVSEHFRTYFLTLEGARTHFSEALKSSPYRHRIFLE